MYSREEESMEGFNRILRGTRGVLLAVAKEGKRREVGERRPNQAAPRNL